VLDRDRLADADVPMMNITSPLSTARFMPSARLARERLSTPLNSR